METTLRRVEWPGSKTQFFGVMVKNKPIGYIAKVPAIGTTKTPWKSYAMPIEGGILPAEIETHYPQKPGRKSNDKAKSEAIRSVLAYHARFANA